MSTKIYTGFRFPASKLSLFSKDVKDLQRRLTMHARSMLSVSLPDILYMEDDTESIRTTIRQYYESNLMASVVIYPRGRMILGTHHISGLYENEFTKLPYIQEYHYQNQTDRPESISKRAWSKRERDWDFLRCPSEDGFVFEIVSPKYMDVFWTCCYRRDLAAGKFNLRSQNG